MESLHWQAWLTLGVLVAMAVALVREVVRPDLVFIVALGALLLAGAVPPEAAFAGFSNTAVFTIGALFVVAAGVQQTGALAFLDRLLFGTSRRRSWVLSRLMIPTAFFSAFLNNTPIVAMLTPRVQEWARRTGVPASKLLIPLSYAAIVGGMMTLVGTSTNIIVSGLLTESGMPGFSMFDLTWIGAPAVVVVIAYLSLVGHRLLPDRTKADEQQGEGLTECLFELRVSKDAALPGKTIDEAGLRALGGAFLIHVRREGHLVPATPDQVLLPGDELAFVGNASTLEVLLARPGLERIVAVEGADDLQTLPLYEAVVAASSELVGKTLRETNFRDRYGGVVLGIHRRGERVDGPLGRTPVKAGDLLLVEAQNGFDTRWNAHREEFYLVAPRRTRRSTSEPRKAPIALAIVAIMFLLVAVQVLPLVTAAFAAAIVMVLSRCVTGTEARRSVNLQVLVIIAAALGIGQAFVRTGLADVLAQGILAASASLGILVMLALLYVVTNVLTEIVANAAAAALMLPIALSAASTLGVEPKALAIVVTIGAAASFVTPIGYQTNLMVMAAGSYRFRDYMKAGAPVSLLVMAVTVTMTYLVWIQ